MMKSIYILSLVILPITSFSQLFVPDGSKWYSSGYDVFSGQPGNPTSCSYDWQTEAVGDTIYNGDTLQVLHHEAYSICSGSTQGNTNVFDAYLKLDSNRVYFGTDITWLTLLYDFNLTIGDTVFQKYYHYLFSPFIDTVLVTNVDSVSYGGTMRKRITFEDFVLPNSDTAAGMVWVEGIGDVNYGLNVINYSFHPDITLDCFISGQETLIGSCYLENESLPKDEFKFEIYPNPFNHLITIKSNIEENIDIQITDIHGKLVHIAQYSPTNSTIDLSDLPVGVFIIHLSGDGFSKSKRIIKVN